MKLNTIYTALLLLLLTFVPLPMVNNVESANAQSSCAGQAAYAYDGTNLVAGNANDVGDPGTCSFTATGQQVDIGGAKYDVYTYSYSLNGQPQSFQLYVPAVTVVPTNASAPSAPNSILPSVPVTPLGDSANSLFDIQVTRPSFNIFYTPDRPCGSRYACWWLSKSVNPIAGVVVLLLLTNILAVALHKLDVYSSRPSSKYALYGGVAGGLLLAYALRFDLDRVWLMGAAVLTLISIGVLWYNRRESMTVEKGEQKQATLWNLWEAYQKDPKSLQDPKQFLNQSTDKGKGFSTMDEARGALQILLSIPQNGKKNKLLSASVGDIHQIPATPYFDGIVYYTKVMPGIDLTLTLIVANVILMGAIWVYGINFATAAAAAGLAYLWSKEYGRELTAAKKVSTNLWRIAGVLIVFLLTLAIIPHFIVAFAAAMITASLLHADWFKEGGFDLGNTVSLVVISVTMWLLVLSGQSANWFFVGTNPVFRGLINLLTS